MGDPLITQEGPAAAGAGSAGFLRRLLALDLEVAPSGRLLKVGAVLAGDTLVSHRSDEAEGALGRLAGGSSRAVAVVGHNLVRHDLHRFRALFPEHPLLQLPVIDTLVLSPIAFPENPYHRLIKDYKLVRESVNDPVADARQSMVVLEEAMGSLVGMKKSDPGMFAALHYLLGTPDDANDRSAAGLDLLFRELGGEQPGVGVALELSKAIVRRHGCCHAPLGVDEVRTGDQRLTLAYALTWLRVAGSNSVLPPWVRRTFPEIVPWLRSVREIPCADALCGYCRTTHNAREQLQKFFGFDDFRAKPATPAGASLQREIVEAGMRDDSLLATMATGGGKSLCFQLPALVRNFRRGVLTIVISPLQALMKDQVDGLMRRTGTPFAAALYGMLTPPERGAVLRRIVMGDIAILYVSPEQLRNRSFREAIAQREVGCWVFDEAHCLSKWGHDFRTDYLYAGRFIREFALAHGQAVPPIACFTATAKEEVRDEIIEHFRVEAGRSLKLFESGVERDNLEFEVEPVATHEKLDRLQERLRDGLGNGDGGSAIVFLATRDHAELTATFLREKGWSAAHFHAGLEPPDKRRIQEEFLAGDIRVICATNAFGMGIDKEDVRLVVHADTPGSLENYLQEAGRAGRDGQRAHCVLLYDEADCEQQFRLGAMSELDRRDIADVLRVLRRAIRPGQEEVVITTGEILRDENLIADLGSAESGADTRVRTAIAWLERAGFLLRDENATSVFQARMLVRNLAEAETRMKALGLSESERVLWLAILREILNAPPTEMLTIDKLALLPEFVEYFAHGYAAGSRPAPEYISARILKILRSMAENKLVKRDLLLNAFVRYKVADHSGIRLAEVLHTERSMLSLLSESEPDPEGWLLLDVRAVNERLLEESCPSTVDRVRALFRSLAEDGRGFAGSHGSLDLRHVARETYRVRVRRRWSAVVELSGKRRRVAGLLVELLLRKIPASTTPKADVLVEFSMEELVDAVEGDLNLRTEVKDVEAAIERALMYLHEQGVLILQSGLAIFRSAMTIRMRPDRRTGGYRVADYEPLHHHYRERILQVHVMGEYARRGLQRIEEARALVTAYFTQRKEAFVRRFFGSKPDLLQYATTARSFQTIVTDLQHPAQMRIVTAKPTENMLVLAGPGSGKTRTVVHRCAYLLRVERVPPRGILICCFNRQAATELRRRLTALVGDDARGVLIQTYHGLALRLLGRSVAGVTRRARAEIHLDSLVPEAVAMLRGGASVVEGAGDEVRDRLLSGFRHILVDEYQDIDEAQYDLISAIAGRTLSDPDQKLSILAVGDDDQNIYTFRGTNVRFIRRFQEDYHAEIHQLVENYRSTSNIIEASNQLIAGNRDRMKVEQPIRIDRGRVMHPAGGEFGRRDAVVRGRVQCVSVPESGALASVVIAEIQRLRVLGVEDWSRMAVLASTHRQLSLVRALAEAEGIPIRWLAGRDVLPSMASIREVRAFLKEVSRQAGRFIDIAELRRILAELFPEPEEQADPWVRFLCRQLDAWMVESHGASAAVTEVLEFLHESFADARRQGEWGDGVTLSTIHAAKGTEYDHVLVVGSWGMVGDDGKQEEARRMLYVGMTRARESLTIVETPHPRGSLVDVLEGPAVHRCVRSGVAGSGPVLAYESLGLDGIYLDYASIFPAYHRVHSALQALRHGSLLNLTEGRDGHLGLCNTEGVVVARLSALGERLWRPRRSSVRSVRVVAMVQRWWDEADTAPNTGRKPEVAEWWVPVVELVCGSVLVEACKDTF